MTDSIMKGNGEVAHMPPYCGLKEGNKYNKSHLLLNFFATSIRDKLGLEISPEIFPDVNLEDTPLYEMYEDNNTTVEGGWKAIPNIMRTLL